MEIICCGDWHIRATPTKYRTSDYYGQLLGKIGYIANFAKKHGIPTILQPGDFLDSPSIPNSTLIDIIKVLADIYVGVVFGQHDLRHRCVEDTALGVLIESETVDLLRSEPASFEDKVQTDIYGASWDSEIPNVKNKNNFNILVLHKMIVKDKPLFPDQKDYCRAQDFSSTLLDYNLIVSGDNHNSFMHDPKNKGFPSIINCGSLMRMTTAQYNHKPCFWVVDTVTGKIIKHYIPILPIVDVFKEEAVDIKERDEKMEAFIKTLDDTRAVTQLSFETNVKILAEEIDSSIKELANKFIGDYYSREKS